MTPMQGSKPNTNKILNALLFSNNANMKKGSLSKSQGLKEICKFSISNVYSWSARLMIRYISGLSRDCCWLCCTWMWSISECITEKLNWRHKESNELPSERTFIFSRYSLVCVLIVREWDTRNVFLQTNLTVSILYHVTSRIQGPLLPEDLKQILQDTFFPSK